MHIALHAQERRAQLHKSVNPLCFGIHKRCQMQLKIDAFWHNNHNSINTYYNYN